MSRFLRSALVSVALFALGAMIGCKSGPTAQQLFETATAAQEQSDFASAIKSYEGLVKSYPKSEFAPKCQFMIGYLYANHLKDEGKAREAYNAFIKAFPDDPLIKDAQWELDHLGMDVNQIEELNKIMSSPDSASVPKG